MFACMILGMSIPCIPKIQSMIEDAWREGFDPQGASQLNDRLQGTKAWIGACEVYTLLTALRVKYVFHKPRGWDCHIGEVSGFWVWFVFLSQQ